MTVQRFTSLMERLHLHGTGIAMPWAPKDLHLPSRMLSVCGGSDGLA